jgi:glycosyltransferase involved in cell wall biosynthesis
MNPLISVVMPVFNRKEVAPRAIRSVLQQEGVQFELVVVDDASDDPAESAYEEVRKAGHTVLYQANNGGPGAARNSGVKLTAGEWLIFLDSDDYWLPAKLQTHLKSLQESGLSIGQTEEIWYRDGQKVNPPKAHRISGGDLFLRSLRAVCVSSSTVMLKRSLFDSFQGFDERFFVCEDYDLWLRIAASEEFDYCPAPLVVKHGGHEDQLSRALPAMDRFRIGAIVKGLKNGTFLAKKGHMELAQRELVRKLRILSKGSAKRGMDRVVELCAAIERQTQDQDYAKAFESCWELIASWAEKPAGDSIAGDDL